MIAVVLSGCRGADASDDEQYKHDDSLLSVPQVPVAQALSDALGVNFSSRTIAAFTASNGTTGAVALTASACKLAVGSPDRSVSAVEASAPASSDDPISRPSRTAAADAIGPSTSAAMNLGSGPITLYCGTRGATITFDRTPGAISTTGSVAELPPSSGTTEMNLVVAGADTLKNLTRHR